MSTGRHNCFNFPPLLSILASRPGKKHWALETLPTYERDLYIMSGLRLCHVQIENCSKKNMSFASEIFVRGRFCFGKLIPFAQVSPGGHCLYAHNAINGVETMYKEHLLHKSMHAYYWRVFVSVQIYPGQSDSLGSSPICI